MNARAGFFAVAILLASRAWADPAPVLPGPAFDGARYTNLWTKSPFAIATPDAPAASQDYELVGMAKFDGVSYVSLIDKQAQDSHFVLSSDKPIKDPKHNLDLRLISISRGPGGATAIIQRNGESLTLRQETPPDNGSTAPNPAAMAFPQPGMVPSPNPSVGGLVPALGAPPARFHHRPIRIPPPPPTQ